MADLIEGRNDISFYASFTEITEKLNRNEPGYYYHETLPQKNVRLKI